MSRNHEWLDLAPAYALDALDPAEEARFETHLADCGRCREAVEEYREATAVLVDASSATAPPPGLRDRILRQAVERGGSTESPGADRRARGFDADGSRARGGWLAAAAGLVLALVASWAYLHERDQRLALEAAYEESLSRVAEQDSLLDVVLGPGVRTSRFAATGELPTGHVFWNRARQKLVVAVHDLPPAPEGRTYQLWGIPPGESPVSLGLFEGDPDREALVTVNVPADLEMAVSAVTEEPAGGSPQPTSEPFLVADW